MRKILSRVSKAMKIVVVIALVFAYFTPIVPANALTLTSVSMTLSTAKPATAANLRVQFTTATAIPGDTTADDADGQILVRFTTDAGGDPFTLASMTTSDISLTGFPANITVNAVTLSSRGGSVANDTVTIGLNQTSGGAAVDIPASTALTVDIINNKITTPSKVAATGTADIWEMSIATRLNDGSTDTDNGATNLATIDVTTVSATVNTLLSLTVAAITSGTAVNGENTTITTTSTTVPYATLAPNTAKYGGQTLSIATNGPNGYILYVVQSQNLTSGSDDIDQYDDGTKVANTAPTSWTSPHVSASDEATHGHLGYTTDDATLGGGTAARFTASGPKFAGIPTIGAAGAAPVTTDRVCDSTAATTGDTCKVGFKVEISPLQPAGSYSSEIYYVLVEQV